MNPRTLIFIAFIFFVWLMFLPLINNLIEPGFVPLVPFAIAGVVHTIRDVKERRAFKDDIDRELADLLKGEN